MNLGNIIYIRITDDTVEVVIDRRRRIGSCVRQTKNRVNARRGENGKIKIARDGNIGNRAVGIRQKENVIVAEAAGIFFVRRRVIYYESDAAAAGICQIFAEAKVKIGRCGVGVQISRVGGAGALLPVDLNIVEARLVTVAVLGGF